MVAEQRARVVEKLHSLLKPFLLRRIKADVEIALPRKQELLLYAPMSKLQRQLNQQLLERTLAVRGRGGSWGFMLHENFTRIVLSRLTRLDQILSSP